MSKDKSPNLDYSQARVAKGVVEAARRVVARSAADDAEALEFLGMLGALPSQHGTNSTFTQTEEK
jgi:hypothetical protein